MKIIITILVIATVILGGALFLVNSDGGELSFSGTVVGNECFATSTMSIGIDSSQVIKSSGGTLCTIVITTPGDQGFILYNATTTVASGRTPSQQATSSIFLVEIAPEHETSTITIDVGFSTGLYFDLVSGSTGTTTITYR